MPMRFLIPWCLGLSICSCVAGIPNVQQAPTSSAGSVANPDWPQLEARCRNSENVDPQRCPLVKIVRRVTDNPRLLSDYLRGVAPDIKHDVGPVEDFVSKAQEACGGGYRQACLAVRLTKIEQRLTEAEATAGGLRTVRSEIALAVRALDGSHTEQMIAEAEGHADAALAAAKAAAEKIADAKAQQEAVKAQQETERAAEEECANDAAKCQADCTADLASDRCWQLAVLIANGDPRVSKMKGDAFVIATANCKARNQSGCTIADKIDSQVHAQLDSAWSQVTDVGDDLVQKQHLVAIAKQWGSAQPRLQRQLPAMLALNQQEIAERYCPARKAFVQLFAQQAGAAEFQKRAAAHCKNETPHGEGISGADVTLTSECVAVYATPCP